MKADLFRKEAVEKITGPEDLNAYIRVINPRVWLILLGVVLAIVGMKVFALSSGYPVWDLFFGHRSF